MQLQEWRRKRSGVDDVAQAAIEAGFMADSPVVMEYKASLENGTQAPDITRALWEAIDAELSGQKQTSNQEAASVDTSHLDHIEEYLNSLGVDLSNTDTEIRAAIEANQAAPERMYAQSSVVSKTIEIDPATEVKVVHSNMSPADVGSWRDEVQWMKDNLQGKTVEAPDGRPVRISQQSRKALSSNRGNSIKAVVVHALPELIAASPIYATAPDIKGRENLTFAYAGGAIEIEGKVYSVGLRYRVDGQGSAIAYQFEGYDLRSGGSISADGNPSAQPSPDRVTTIGEIVASFNSNPLFQKNSDGPHGAIQFMADGRSIISLFETANLSTLQHEMGHLFLTMIQRDAAGGDQSSVAELEIVKSWWRDNASDVAADGNKAMPDAKITVEDVQRAIDTGTTGDAAKDTAVDVGMQEQWARGYEAYLMEGKSPSVELRSAFERFRSWMLSVYKSLRGLNVEITPEIRAVFDRMLATDEEIAKAKNASGDVGSVLATAEQMGLTPEQFDRLMKLRTQAEDEAKARLQREIMEPIKRQKEEWWKAEKAKAEEEVTRQVNAMPVFRALEWLGNRRWLGNGKPDAMQDMRLSRDVLVQRYGEGVLKTLQRGKFTVYANEGGMDPDDVAGWFGFDSGDQMIRAMERAPKRLDAIRDETARVMNERHGDATEVVKALCARRLGFVRGLKTFGTFGRGWSRRIADIEAKGVAMALRGYGAGKPRVAAVLAQEAETAIDRSKAQNKGAAAVTGSGAAGGAVQVGADVNWLIVAGVALAVVAILALVRSRAVINKDRAEAYLAASKAG